MNSELWLAIAWSAGLMVTYSGAVYALHFFLSRRGSR